MEEDLTSKSFVGLMFKLNIAKCAIKRNCVAPSVHDVTWFMYLLPDFVTTATEDVGRKRKPSGGAGTSSLRYRL